MANAIKENRKEPLLLLTLAIVGLIVSGIRPYDRLTWLLEVLPVLIGIPILIFSFRRFPLTPLLYLLLFIHAIILMIGGHYTYARVPVGFWIQDIFHFTRNPYDRLGHLAQGFIPAILTREILLRCTPLYSGKWLFFLVTSVCLAFSAFYELFEWWTALAQGEAANDFLGTQGDVWDTQWDMFCALLGAVTAQLTLSRLHDRELTQVSLK